MATSLRSALRTWLPRVVAFVAVTIPLTWLWLEVGGELYGRLFSWAAPAVYSLVGLDGAPVEPERLRYINLVTFVGLMLVTPRLSWSRRLGGLALGLVLLFFSHVWINAIDVVVPRKGALYLPAALLCDVLPFLLWILLTRRSLGSE